VSPKGGRTKPLKYPVMFREGRLRADHQGGICSPYLPVEVERFEEHIHCRQPCANGVSSSQPAWRWASSLVPVVLDTSREQHPGVDSQTITAGRSAIGGGCCLMGSSSELIRSPGDL